MIIPPISVSRMYFSAASPRDAACLLLRSVAISLSNHRVIAKTHSCPNHTSASLTSSSLPDLPQTTTTNYCYYCNHNSFCYTQPFAIIKINHDFISRRLREPSQHILLRCQHVVPERHTTSVGAQEDAGRCCRCQDQGGGC